MPGFGSDCYHANNNWKTDVDSHICSNSKHVDPNNQEQILDSNINVGFQSPSVLPQVVDLHQPHKSENDCPDNKEERRWGHIEFVHVRNHNGFHSS